MRKKLIPLLLGTFVTLMVSVFTWNSVYGYFSALPRLNNILYDVTFKAFHNRNKPENVVIVDVDDKSLTFEGKWPWSRDKVADMVRVLQESGAAVIAFDVLFPEKDFNAAQMLLNYLSQQPKSNVEVANYLSAQLSIFDYDLRLAEVLSKSDVVLGIFFNDKLYQDIGVLGKPFLGADHLSNLIVPKMTHYTGSIAPLIEAARYTAGFVTTIPDEDGILRRSPMFIEYNHALYPALALEAARLYFLIDKVSLDTRQLGKSRVLLGINLGDIYIPTDSAGKLLIQYLGPSFTFPYVSATDVLHKKFPAQVFSGKVVIIGSSAVGIGDMHAMPLQLAGYPGCEVHANLIENIVAKNFISSPIWIIGLERIIIIVVGLTIAILSMYSTVFILFILTIGGEFLIFAIQAWLWTHGHWILPHMILPYLLVLLLGIINMCYGYLFESRYRKQIHDVYGQYVSSTYIDRMLEHPDQYTLSGRSKEMTVLFSDVRSFTSLSEQLDSAGVKTFLNQLFTPLTEIIFEHKGTIDKYVGDMVMAFWNDPIEDPQHAQHAVLAGLKMVAKVKELAPVFAEQGLTNVRVGVGINTGTMHVGDMGSKYRKSYTVLGDAVNLASRLESANKFYGTSILVSNSVKEMSPGVIFRFIDKVVVKGKHLPINVYEPICLQDQLTKELESELREYDLALKAYYARDWCQAKNRFDCLNQKYPKEGVYRIYFTRTQQFECTEPSCEWEGTHTLDEK